MQENVDISGKAGCVPHVVIIGGGFGGLSAAGELARQPIRVTVIDRRNYYLFQPLLYQVATAALNPSDIAAPIRRILRRQNNSTVILGDVVSVNTKTCEVLMRDGGLVYDYLIVASGASHSYFGHSEWAQWAPGLKSVEDATDIRRRFLVAFEAAERETDPQLQREWLTFVIVGGGPTGVELAGALAEISRHVLERDFRRIRTGHARIILIEGSSRVLSAMSEASSKAAARDLERLGVEVTTSTMVSDIDGNGVTCGDRRIGSRTVIWAAGVAASPLGRALGAPVDRAGRVKVNEDLSVPGAPGVFAIGDLAALMSGGRQVPGLAAAAMQEGRHAALNVLRLIRGQETRPFKYKDKGTLATIGRGAAVADLGRLHVSGIIAWLVWLLVHIFYLIGFRNRVLVLAQWGWVYLRNERGARLITGDVEPLLEHGRSPQHHQRQ